MDFSIFILKNKKIKRLVNINLLISFLTCLSGIIILYIYDTYIISFDLFQIGITVFRTGLLIGVFSYMFGVVFENYLNIR